jgi:hypothetical protein
MLVLWEATLRVELLPELCSDAALRPILRITRPCSAAIDSLLLLNITTTTNHKSQSLDPELSNEVGLSVRGLTISVHVRVASLFARHPFFRPKDPPPPVNYDDDFTTLPM